MRNIERLAPLITAFMILLFTAVFLMVNIHNKKDTVSKYYEITQIYTDDSGEKMAATVKFIHVKRSDMDEIMETLESLDGKNEQEVTDSIDSIDLQKSYIKIEKYSELDSKENSSN